MKKLISIALSAVLVIGAPLSALGDESTLVSGQFVDVQGNPITQLRFTFTFSDKSSASGLSDANGKFLLNGKLGSYTFRIKETFPCIEVNFKSTFSSSREVFKLVFPQKTTYSVNVLDRNRNQTYGGRFNIQNLIFADAPNEQFGNPLFTCARGIYSQSATYARPNAEISTHKLNLEAMKSTGRTEYLGIPRADALVMDSISGSNNSISLDLADFEDGLVEVTSDKLPTFETPSAIYSAKSHSIFVRSRLNESEFYAGIAVPRTVQAIWRWKTSRKNSKWTQWRGGLSATYSGDGEITAKIRTSFTGAETKGSKIEIRIVGQNFGSMSPVKTLLVK